MSWPTVLDGDSSTDIRSSATDCPLFLIKALLFPNMQIHGDKINDDCDKNTDTRRG